MSGFLLDTNTPSELTRPRSAPQVEDWLDKTNDERLYFSVISLRGKQIKVADGLIVATALHHRLTIVIRNIRDFAGLGAGLLNPWDLA